MIIIKNGRVHNGRGSVEQADIVIDGGIITRIARNIPADGAEVIDAAGMEVFPGFVDAQNVWGITGPGWTGDDRSEDYNPVTPEMNVVYAFDHDGMNFQRVYSYGVTSACIAPSPCNVLRGQAAVFKTRGRSPYDMLVKESAAMTASVTKAVKDNYSKRPAAPMTRMGIFSLLTDKLEKARRYNEDKDGYDSGCIAMKRVLTGDLPLFVNCATRAEITALTAALRPYEAVRLVLTGAYGLDAGMELVTSGKLPVIMGDHTEAFNTANYVTEFERIIPLMESGAPIAIGCCGDNTTSGRESLLWNALFWIRRGLSPEKVLECISYTPAKILGVENRIGSIEIGKDADITVWSKNPFETYEARITAALISGRDAFRKEDTPSCW